jgi:hypothetical protein
MTQPKLPETTSSNPLNKIQSHDSPHNTLETPAVSIENDIISQAERKILGQIIYSAQKNHYYFLEKGESYGLTLDIFSPIFQPLYQAILDLYSYNYPINSKNILASIKENGKLDCVATKSETEIETLPLLFPASKEFQGPLTEINEFLTQIQIVRNAYITRQTINLWNTITSISQNTELTAKQQLKSAQDSIWKTQELLTENTKTFAHALTIKENINKYFEEEPPKPDFIIDGFRSKTVGCIIGPGGAGKSFFFLQMACAVACGKDWCSKADPNIVNGDGYGDILNLQPGGNDGKVIFITAEDTSELIWERIHALHPFFKLETRNLIAKNLDIHTTHGINVNFSSIDKSNNLDIMTLIKRSQGARLIMIDPLICFHSSDENKNNEMAQIIGLFKTVAEDTGASVIYSHHTTKSATKDIDDESSSQTSARGGGASIDLVRYAANLFIMSKKDANEFNIQEQDRTFYVGFKVVKVNGTFLPEKQYFQRPKKDRGVLTPVKLEKKIKNNDKEPQKNKKTNKTNFVEI